MSDKFIGRWVKDFWLEPDWRIREVKR